MENKNEKENEELIINIKNLQKKLDGFKIKY